MKQTFTIISAMLLSASAVTYIANTATHTIKNSQQHSISREGMEDDADGRMRWELKRLADPATGKIPENVRAEELAYATTLPNDAQVTGNRTAVWNSRGPWNVGGTTRAFAIDVTNENRILAGTNSGGVWLSTDGGASWNPTNTPTQLKGANCLVQDRRTGHTNVWYYGGGNPWASAGGGGSAYYLGDGVFKSTDGGLSWQSIPATAGASPNSYTSGWQMMHNMATDFSAADTTEEVYAAINGGIYRTVNGGTTWSAARAGGSYFTEVAVTTTGIVYATLSSDGSQRGIWRSVDGVTYTQIKPTIFPTTYDRIAIGINPNDENEIYFVANSPNYGKKVLDYLGSPHWNSLWKYNYITGDGAGANGTWQDLSINLPATGGMFDKFHTQDSYDMVIKVKPGNSNIVFIGGTNLYRSTTAFQDSTNTAFIGGYEQFSALPVINSYLNHHPDQQGLEFLASNPDIMISANDGGVFKTTDNTASAVVWQSLDNGYLTSMFYTVAIDHSSANNDIVIGGAQDNGSWFTNNSTPTAPWFHAHGGDGAYCAVADNQSAYYFSIQNLQRLVKANLDANGNTTSFARIDPIGGKGYQWMNPFVLDPNNNDMMYLTGGKYLWRNSDLSAIPLNNTWDSISTNWTRWTDSVPTSNSEITAVVACKTPANRVYYGTDKKRIYRVDNANVGTPTPVDISSTVTTALFPSNGYVSCIAVDPTDGNKLMVIFSNYSVYSIFYSTDAGATWSKAGGNLETSSVAGPSVRWASILPVSDGKLYFVATSTGLYAADSLSPNTQWVQQGANTIGNVVCDMIETRPSDGLVVVATHATGMYSTKITSVNDIVSVKDIEASKSDFGLKNYPNPVSQTTTIEFTLNKKAKVNLQIIDEYGRVVETLINQSMQEGKQTVAFDRKNLRAGIYYYSLTVGDRRKTNKMIIVK